MSQIHRIEHQVSEHTFELYNVYNGERTIVRIDPDKISLYEDRSIFEQLPEACPFLRRDPNQKEIICTIHLTRPELCREFGCWRLLILDPDGNRAGRIMGSRHLGADDTSLLEFWESEVATFRTLDDDSWDRAVIQVLERRGYQVMTSETNPSCGRR
ncbi:MAG: YkgJ family cysteine cluster protein [Methanomicrobiales archaeon]|nr:YkgJ family cysteine cluster protein [Methanomicrobiales archaeon]